MKLEQLIGLPLLAIGLIFGTLPGRAEEPFLAGADVSHVRFFEDRGVTYQEEGQVRDAFQILKDQGLNSIRLRLFTSSPAQAQADPYNSINNLQYTLPLAVRARKAGLRLLLDFHYSDTWADPARQSKPAAWTNLTFLQLEAQMREYNSNCIASFKAAGAMPEDVQIGNEIIGGLLWPEGRVGGNDDTPLQWSQLGRLLKAAILGVKDASGSTPPRIMIHIDRGGDWKGTQWFFDNLRAQQVEFDLIGQSYYPFWHGTLDALRGCLTNAVLRYGKPVVVAETAFPWTNSAPVLGIPATPEGQTQFLIELAKVLKGLPGGRGQGVFWWGTEYQHLNGVNTAGFEGKSLFGTDGAVLPAAGALGQLAAPIVLRGSVSHSSLILNWPLSGAGLALMSTTGVTPSALWVPVNNPIQNAGMAFATSVPLANTDAGFFRLQGN